MTKNLLLGVAAVILPVSAAQAGDMVTYNWVTTSEGYGNHVGSPTASFEVPLASVLAGEISYSDITDIQIAYAGLNLTVFTPTSIGLDSAAFVDATTGAPVYHDNDQGLGVVGYQGGLFSDSFVSITFDSIAYSPSGQPLGGVADQFNALNGGSAYAGYPTAGHWVATFPTIVTPPSPTGGVPEPASWALMLGGFGMVGAAMRARRTATVSFS